MPESLPPDPNRSPGCTEEELRAIAARAEEEFQARKACPGAPSITPAAEPLSGCSDEEFRALLAAGENKAKTMRAGPAPSAPANAARAPREVPLTLCGAGAYGRWLARQFIPIPGVSIRSVCDVDAGARARLADELATLQKYRPAALPDVRQALTDGATRAVVVASPDHWHALHALWAIRAGKDVYLASPPALSMAEARWISDEAAAHGALVQVGLEHRSAGYPLKARQLIQDGWLGTVHHVRIVNPLPAPSAPPTTGMWGGQYGEDDDHDDRDQDDDDLDDVDDLDDDGGRAAAAAARLGAPAGLEWDGWLGPAPVVAYSASRQRGWSTFWSYGGGPLLSHGLPLVDLALLALGERGLPRSVTCLGGRPFGGGGGDRQQRRAERAPKVQGAIADFGRWYMTIDSGHGIGHAERLRDDAVSRGPEQPFWATCPHVEITGTAAAMRIAPQGCGFVIFRARGEVIAEVRPTPPRWWHQKDFIDSVRARTVPRSDIDAVRPSAALLHMVNISYRVGGKQLRYDWRGERFTNCEEANALLRIAYRAPYDALAASTITTSV